MVEIENPKKMESDFVIFRSARQTNKVGKQHGEIKSKSFENANEN